MSDFVRDLYRSIASPMEPILEFVLDRDGVVRKVFHVSAPLLLKATTSLTPMGRMAGMGYAALAETAILSAYVASWTEYLYEAKVLHNAPTALMFGGLAVEALVTDMHPDVIEQEKEKILDVAPWTPLEWPF